MNHVSRLIVLFLSLSLTAKGQKLMDIVTARSLGSAAVAAPEAADPMEANRGGEGTGREDDVQGRFSANQTNEDPPTSRRDEGILGSSTQRAPQGESDGSTEPGVMTLQVMLEADITSTR